MEFYSTTEKNEILSLPGKWMGLDILSEVSQVHEAKYNMISLCGI
jgi:hypothetical protein